MSTEGNSPSQVSDFDDAKDVGWIVAQSLLRAQSSGYRAMEDYLLLMYHDRMHRLENPELQTLLDDAIATHEEIIEDLECAQEGLDTLAESAD